MHTCSRNPCTRPEVKGRAKHCTRFFEPTRYKQHAIMLQYKSNESKTCIHNSLNLQFKAQVQSIFSSSNLYEKWLIPVLPAQNLLSAVSNTLVRSRICISEISISLPLTVEECNCGPDCQCTDSCKGGESGCCLCVCKGCDGSPESCKCVDKSKCKCTTNCCKCTKCGKLPLFVSFDPLF